MQGCNTLNKSEVNNMTEIRTEPRRFTQEYGQLSPANKAVFKTILELAVILLKAQSVPNNETKKEESA